ncbi:hypothetical protein MNBD_GAMMA12-3728 [hydrothermal vent metagenome]|uniref:Ferric uptake regulation protein n=1 Tax=hydrothermal vent metagenome TaxID=652676 RepID=A0A3B0YAP2_9ZZZZ
MSQENEIWPKSKQQITAMLEDFDIQPTQQRLVIAEVLFSRAQHLSAEHILEKVNSVAGTVSKATVYNTLGLFVGKGLVHQVNVDPSRVFYDSNIHPHYHFYNIQSGELSDIEPASINISQFPALPAGTSILAVDVIIRVTENDACQNDEDSKNSKAEGKLECSVDKRSD